MLTKCLLTLEAAVLLILIYHPERHGQGPTYFNYISVENVYEELVLNNNSFKYHTNYIQNCSYRDLILSNQDVDSQFITDAKTFQMPITGGEYIPQSCRPLIRTALITPFRNRTQQLKIFLNYMHSFLQKQNIHYRIFVVEQNDSLPFNRAKMFNYGAHLAINLKYDCLILHDVDLIPLSTGNIYGCSKKPRHMSSSIDIFRYKLPYARIYGGVGSILSHQYQSVNGMSNAFYGWGGEDDDFYGRLQGKNLTPYRFDPDLSKYSMLFHKKQKPK